VRRRLTAIRAGLSNLWPVILPGLVIALAVGTSLNFWLLVPALSKLKAQSEEGQKARATQCEVFPVTLKVYTAAVRYRLISEEDLATYRRASPTGCPPRRK
jgi:hypothetical protein